MMKTKRTWIAIVALSMLCGTFAGCGETSTSSTGDTGSADAASSNADSASSEEDTSSSGDYSDTITLVWYPNESAEDYQDARNEVGKLIEQATGKAVEQKLTTDYAIAIESLSNGTAQIGCCMGAEGYIQAKNANDSVNPLFVQSGESGTLEDALYYSFFAVKEENADQYLDGDSYSIDNIKGKKMSFVSNSSTSGFKVPTNQIISHFAEDNLIVDPEYGMGLLEKKSDEMHFVKVEDSWYDLIRNMKS